ncbi:MAG: type II secretion system protein GspG [Gammaproteobacteria bacterium]|nr:type II secretion system protein GspG [Gammaproteobacteria bacterium]
MVVVIIIGVLAVLVVQNVLPQADKARITAAKADIRTLAAALDTYRLDNSFYPSTNQGLEALVAQPSGSPAARNWGPEPYMRKLPVDPWGNGYSYANEGFVFEIISYGADREEGGEGVAADIRFSEL